MLIGGGKGAGNQAGGGRDRLIETVIHGRAVWEKSRFSLEAVKG